MVERKNSLWNKNFIAFSSSIFIEYMSNAGMAFVVSLLVLESTKSVFLYGMYLVLYYSASVFIPILIGPVLEKRNKKNINGICCLIPAVIYGIYLLLYLNGAKAMIFVFAMAIITGIFQAIFYVSANALMLELVEPEHLQKAYSVYSCIEICSEISVPIITILYKNSSLPYILLPCVALFVISAIISVKGIHATLPVPTEGGESHYKEELTEGLQFVKQNRAYLLVCVAFLLCFMTSGIRRTVWLPFFEFKSKNSYLWYFGIYSLFSTGLFHASVLLYLLKIKPQHRYALSVVSFIMICAGMVVALYCKNIPAVIIAYFVGLSDGIFGNMRSVSVYANLDESKRARFSGIFTAFTNAGTVIGTAFSSVLSTYLALTTVNTILCIVIVAVFIFLYMFIGHKEVKALYNNAV